MDNLFSRWLIGFSYRIVEWLRRACPESIRRWFKRLLGGRGIVAIDNLTMRNAQASMRQQQRAMTAGMTDEYRKLLASNATDALVDVMNRFYTDLGSNPHSAPLVQALERFQQNLCREDDGGSDDVESASSLIRFETAWKLYRQQRVDVALRLFETVFRDADARKKAARDPFVREAVVRSGEVLGRHYDTLGDVEQAIAIYRDIVAIDADGVFARRLAVLLARRGDLFQAAELAESIIVNRPNLFRSMPANPYVAALKEELWRKPSPGT